MAGIAVAALALPGKLAAQSDEDEKGGERRRVREREEGGRKQRDGGERDGSGKRERDDDERNQLAGERRGKEGGVELDDILSRALWRVPERVRPQVMEIVQQHFGRELREVQALARVEPMDAKELLGDLVAEAMELLELREENPEAFERRIRLAALEREAQELGGICADRGGEERAEPQKKLREVLTEAFNIKLEMMKQEAKALEQELDRLKILVDKRQASREAIVERRLKELTGEEDVLDW